jgi:hypothetical protein
MELTINSLIKLIIGIFVVVIVVFAFYYFFKDYVSGVFGGYANNTPLDLVLYMIQ